MKRNETIEERKTRKAIESYAWDATVGAGNDSETVEFEALEERLGRKPTEDERQTFKEAWRECLQEMAQP